MNRIVEPLLNALLDQQPVDDYFDRVVAAFVEFDFFIKLANLAVDASAIESRAGELFEFLLELAFSAANDRRKYHHSFAFGKRRHLLDDLVDRLARDRLTALWAMGLAD